MIANKNSRFTQLSVNFSEPILKMFENPILLRKNKFIHLILLGVMQDTPNVCPKIHDKSPNIISFHQLLFKNKLKSKEVPFANYFSHSWFNLLFKQF